MGTPAITQYDDWKGRLGWRVVLAHYAIILNRRHRMDAELVQWAHAVMGEYRTRWTR